MKADRFWVAVTWLLLVAMVVAIVGLSAALVASFQDSPAARGRTHPHGSHGAERLGTAAGRDGLAGPLARPAAPHASRSRSRLDLLDWHALALCESGDDPRAVSPSGRFRGLYQFDRATWRSVGGTGDPAAASREEQTSRALVLFTSRGRQPWPVCGRHL